MTENQREAIKEEIKYRTEIIKLLTILLLSVGGGTVGILLKHQYRLWEIIFSVGGIVVFFLIGVALAIEHSRLMGLIKSLKEEER